jgi:HlyD family secretion protein
MKRAAVPIIIIALAGAAFYFRDRWLPPPPGQANYLGYIEGETILIASPVAGRIVERRASKGGSVKAGDVLFRLDATQQDAEVERLAAAVTTAEAQLANLKTGKRATEQEIVRAQRREVEAALILAQQELQRATELTSTGTAAKARWDTAESQVHQLEARLEQIDATLAAGELAGREADIAAAMSRVAEAKSALAQAEAKRHDLSPRTPRAADVENTFFDAGEWVAAGQPVISLQPPGDVTLRFYVPQQVIATLTAGTHVRFNCDGCGGPLAAKVTSIATEPEYTPPVIYSQGARAKLVYLVEASPVTPSDVLRPGLPIEVEPLP